MPDSTNDKTTLRAQLLAARKTISQGDVNIIPVAEYFLELIPAGTIVAGYIATNDELDILPVLEKLAARGNIIALPCIAQNQKILEFREWVPGTELITGAYNIPCPPASAKIMIPDVVIVPLLGFDANGHRIGYGAGYYDATIAHLRAQNNRIKCIGAAYSVQQINNIPHEPHDERLDAVVTEKGIVQ